MNRSLNPGIVPAGWDQPETVQRFSASSRALHWALALATLGLFASGVPLLLPALQVWIRGYDPRIGLRLHLALCVFLLAPVAVFLLGDRRALQAEARELVSLSREDLAWLASLPAFLLGRRHSVEALGRYNGGQKLNAALVLLSLLGLTLTGLALWLGAPRPLLPLLRGAHDVLTVALGLLIAGHAFLATLHPRTRPALRGMVDGRVPLAWAARQYPRWTVEALRCEAQGASPRGPTEPQGHRLTLPRGGP